MKHKQERMPTLLESFRVHLFLSNVHFPFKMFKYLIVHLMAFSERRLLYTVGDRFGQNRF